MPLSLIVCAALSTLCVSPYQGEKASPVRIEKTDTLADLVNKLSVAAKKTIIVDGSVGTQKLGLEGDFTQEALITYLKDTLDYDYVRKEDAVVFFKWFRKEGTLPDYSLAEIMASLKDIKAIVTPVLGGRTGRELVTTPFVEAVQGLGPELTKQMQTDQVGVPIASLPPAMQKKIVEAMYYTEYRGFYSEFQEVLEFAEKLDSLTVSKPDANSVIYFRSEANAINLPINVSKLERAEGKPPVAPAAFAFLKDTVAQDRPEYSFKLNPALEDHSLLAANKTKLSPREVRMVSELNRWSVKPEATNNSTVYAVSRAKPGTDANLPRKMIEALPGSVSRYVMGPFTHIDTIPIPENRYPGSVYEKALHISRAQLEMEQRTKKLSDSELLTVADWVGRKPANQPIPVKEMPEEVKRALVNGLLMRALSSVGRKLVGMATTPYAHLENPQEYSLICIQGKTNTTVTVQRTDRTAPGLSVGVGISGRDD